MGVEAACALRRTIGCKRISLNGCLSVKRLNWSHWLISLNGLISLNRLISLNGLISLDGLISLNNLISFNGLISLNGLIYLRLAQFCQPPRNKGQVLPDLQPTVPYPFSPNFPTPFSPP